jgi:hypothetical protein
VHGCPSGLLACNIFCSDMLLLQRLLLLLLLVGSFSKQGRRRLQPFQPLLLLTAAATATCSSSTNRPAGGVLDVAGQLILAVSLTAALHGIGAILNVTFIAVIFVNLSISTALRRLFPE